MNGMRVLDTFLDLVRIDSPSGHEAAVAAYCERALRDAGCSVRFDGTAPITGSDTGNLVAVLPATPGCSGSIALSAHMDTVEPGRGVRPVVDGGIVRSSGDTILGADDKAGIAAIIEAVRSVAETGAPHPEVTVVLTVREEDSLVGSTAVDPATFPEGAFCYVLDAGGDPGTIILGSPCHYEFEAAFKGRASHAGAAPEEGRSAIAMAAAAVAAMPLGRIDELTTANVGAIEGGTAVNVVPERCVVHGECRSIEPSRACAVRAEIERACEQAAERFGGDFEVRWSFDYDATNYAPDDDIAVRAARAAEACGLVPVMANSGGGADANAFATKGVAAITLGIGMTNYHALDEFIRVRDIEDTARLAEELVMQAAEGGCGE